MKQAFRTEDDWVDWLHRGARNFGAPVPLGIGDDAALVEFKAGLQTVVTSDLSVEGVHFRRSLHPPDSVGHRALARSLSDIAAMGGTPRFALVSVQLSRHLDRAWIESFFRGMLLLAQRFGVTLIGGDTAVTGSRVTVDVAVLGEIERGQALLRSGAQPGDSLFVAGTLGLSALGLRRLRSRPKGRQGEDIKAHLYPEPQCELGRFLARRQLASAAIDVSDGLSSDLTRLLKTSAAGGRIREAQIPKPRGLDSRSALTLALDGGEDYKLLFAVRPEKVRQVPKRFRETILHNIGIVCERSQGIRIEGANGDRTLRAGGYDHFRRRR